jgi:hypothetical protein
MTVEWRGGEIDDRESCVSVFRYRLPVEMRL